MIILIEVHFMRLSRNPVIRRNPSKGHCPPCLIDSSELSKERALEVWQRATQNASDTTGSVTFPRGSDITGRWFVSVETMEVRQMSEGVSTGSNNSLIYCSGRSGPDYREKERLSSHTDAHELHS